MRFSSPTQSGNISVRAHWGPALVVMDDGGGDLNLPQFYSTLALLQKTACMMSMEMKGNKEFKMKIITHKVFHLIYFLLNSAL